MKLARALIGILLIASLSVEVVAIWLLLAGWLLCAIAVAHFGFWLVCIAGCLHLLAAGRVRG